MSYLSMNDTYIDAHAHELFVNCTTVEHNSSWFIEQGCRLLFEVDPTDLPQGPPKQPWWIHLIVQILYGIVCCVGLCGNTLVIYVVVRFSKMQTVTNLYIVNLAIADECFLVGIPFLMTTIGLGYWPFGNIVCKAYFTSTSINQITSSMFLLIMSADRYLAVCHPISAPRFRTPMVAKIVALTAWTCSALIMVPIYIFANTLEIDNKINCNIFWPSSETWTGESIFIVYSFIISFAVPFILIMVFYVLVIMKLKTVGPKRRPLLPSNQQAGGPNTVSTTISLSGDRKPSADPSSQAALMNHMTPQQASRAKDRKRSHKKVTKLVLTVITVYFLCWAPYWATQMALIFMPHDSNHSDTMLTLFLLAGCFSYSNSTMNPILYAFLSDNFKKSFLKACTCAKGQDVNAQLHLENSVFPRGKKSEKGNRKASATSGVTGPGNTGPNSALVITNANTNTGFVSGAKNMLSVPNSAFSKSRALHDEDDESGESEDDDGAAILGTGGVAYNVSGGLLNVPLNTPSTSTTGGMNSHSDNTQSTFIQEDGLHVTAL